MALYAVLGLTALLIVLIIVFFNHFEKTWIGKLFYLRATIYEKAGYVSNDVLDDLVGKEGVAHTTLRPAGIAKIDGNLVDVVDRRGLHRCRFTYCGASCCGRAAILLESVIKLSPHRRI